MLSILIVGMFPPVFSRRPHNLFFPPPPGNERGEPCGPPSLLIVSRRSAARLESSIINNPFTLPRLSVVFVFCPPLGFLPPLNSLCWSQSRLASLISCPLQEGTCLPVWYFQFVFPLPALQEPWLWCDPIYLFVVVSTRSPHPHGFSCTCPSFPFY